MQPVLQVSWPEQGTDRPHEFFPGLAADLREIAEAIQQGRMEGTTQQGAAAWTLAVPDLGRR